MALLDHLVVKGVKFPPGVLLITCATWILPRYAFTVELLRPFLLIAHVVKALAVPKSTGRLLLMFIELQNALYKFHAEQCLAQVCWVPEYIISLSKSWLIELVSLLSRLLVFRTFLIDGFCT